jgi:selenocysteine-specific elongation factor
MDRRWRKCFAGDRAAINLIGLKREEFERGMILCNKPLESTQMIDAWVQLFDAEVSLPIWSNVIFISGTFECQARMHLLNKDKVEGKRRCHCADSSQQTGSFVQQR